jgi:hypothetical protein
MRKFFSGALIVLLAGCPATREIAQPGATPERPSADVRRAEESFNPSDYQPLHKTEHDSTFLPRLTEATPATPPPAQAPELVPGYRVQLLSTTSIDEANARRLYAESLFPDELFYLQYDPPTYKIRAGNFLLRFDADRFRSQAAERGFSGAWVVPERVFKNPPPPIRIPTNPK